MIPSGKANSDTKTPIMIVPTMPWTTPACDARADVGEVRKSMPRSASTGTPPAAIVSSRVSSIDSENSSASSRISLEGDPPVVAPGLAQGAADDGGGRAHRRLLVRLPGPADEVVADLVQGEGDEEQHQAEEEQALVRGAVAGHLVRARTRARPSPP